MLTSNLVPCFVQTFKTDSKTGYEKALLVGVFDKTTTDLDCCISSSSRDTGKPVSRLPWSCKRMAGCVR